MSVHANPAAQLARVLRLCGRQVTVTYRRAGISAQVPATPAVGRIDLMTAEQLGLRTRNRDWLIEQADLVLDGQETTPAVGDLIEHKAAGKLVTWRVSPLGDQPCFDPIDESGVLLRVHSQRVGTEDAA